MSTKEYGRNYNRNCAESDKRLKSKEYWIIQLEKSRINGKRENKYHGELKNTSRECDAYCI